MSGPSLGVTLPQFTGDPEVLLGAARRAEELGLDSVWVFDHLWPLTGGKQRDLIECWTALAWLAAVTSRVRIGTLVTRSSLRHPALLAKMAATVAAIAPGRLIVTVGSGDEASRPENEAFGIPYFSGPNRIAQLAVTVEILSAYTGGSTVTHEDRLVAISDLPPSPTPATRPEIWVAGNSDAVLDLAARRADGWNGWGLTPGAFSTRVARLDGMAGARPVVATWAGLAVLADNDAEAESKLGGRDPRTYLIGGPDTLAERLRALGEAGARHLVVTFPDAGRPGSYELLGRHVAPVVRRAN